MCVWGPFVHGRPGDVSTCDCESFEHLLSFVSFCTGAKV